MGDTVDFDSLDRVVNLVSKPTPTLTIKHIVKLTRTIPVPQNNNGGGWVFLDYRNNNDFNNKNSIIYAHGRKNKTMFGTLLNILNEDWYQNKDNYVIKTNVYHQQTSSCKDCRRGWC